MAETDPKVMSLVEAALEKDPNASVETLYDMAKKASRAVGKMNLRQFHARYPLQVKRRKNKAAKASSAKAGAKVGTRKRAARKAAAPKAAKAAKATTRKAAASKAAPKATRRKAAASKAAPKAAAKTASRRGRKPARRGRPATRAAAQANGSAMAGRDGVRAVFLSFAEELAAAEGRKDAVRVVASVDRYVDRAIKALR